VPTPFEVQGQGEKLQLSEDTRLAAQEMLELGLNQVGVNTAVTWVIINPNYWN
jgi:hypothetical protein